MMKKCFVLLLLLALLPVASGMGEEAAALPTVDELMAYGDALLAEAMKVPGVTATEAEEGGYQFDFEDFILTSPEKVLTEDSVISGVTLLGAEEYRADMRGIAPGSMLGDVLDAYPLDNPSLRGTYEGVVLSIEGELPGTVNCGYAVRNGSHVLVIEYDIYTADGDTVEKCCVLYTLENNTVIASEILLNVQTLTLEEAQAEIDARSALQEADAYSVYTADQPEALAREDLRFGGIDFISAGDAVLEHQLGKADSDTWEADGANFLHIMQWSGVQAIFRCDSSRTNGSLQLLQVFSDVLEGPRNLHMGDDLQSVFARFPQENSSIENNGEGGMRISIPVEVEEKTVLLTLTLIDDRLADITCSYR